MTSPIRPHCPCSLSVLEKSPSVLNYRATHVELARLRFVLRSHLSIKKDESYRLRSQCDRIQPCTACSLHQIADHCEFDLSESERHPILQAEALKEKDKTIAQLRNEVATLRGDTIKAEPLDEVVSFGSSGPKIKLPPQLSSKKVIGPGQKRDYLGEMSANIYFGSPGMTSVVEEVSGLFLFQLTIPVQLRETSSHI